MTTIIHATYTGDLKEAHARCLLSGAGSRFAVELHEGNIVEITTSDPDENLDTEEASMWLVESMNAAAKVYRIPNVFTLIR